jgi:hypothetical protein
MLRKRFAILFALIGIGASAGTAQPRPKGAILATPHFAFHSDLDANTHDARNYAARAATEL